MSLAGNRIGKIVLAAAGSLLLTAGGCSLWWQRPDPDHDLFLSKASDLRPGAYCEIEMNVPLTSSGDSSHCYKGKVKEVTSDEIVLSDVLEQTQIDYAGSGRHREPTQEKHDVVRVPMTGVREIYALRPKNTVVPPAASAPSAPPKLPSQGARPVVPADGTAHFD